MVNGIPRRVPSAFLAAIAPLSRESKDALLRRNAADLEEDLWLGRLEFRSRPRVADVQFSNYCNMACTMCYPDGNPPLEVMPQPLLEKLSADLFPTLTSLEPFAGSEPLVFTWELTRRLAELFRLELDLVTNAQYLDEKRFLELEPFVSAIRLSVDSHDPEVYARIRLKSQPATVFRNLASAARLCREHAIEAIVNVVFMAENAPTLDQTVAHFAELGVATVNLLQYHYTDERGAASDPYRQLPKEQIEALFERIRAVAREKRIAVFFDLDQKETVDFRSRDVKFRPNARNDVWLHRFRQFFPGYCLQSVNRVKVNADGSVYPCCVGGGEQLKLGNLQEKSFEQIWNGPESQDLRRAMLTQDLPPLCRDCSFVRGWYLPEQARMLFHGAVEERLGVTRAAPDESLGLVAPAHMARAESPPRFAWTLPATNGDGDGRVRSGASDTGSFAGSRVVLVLAAGGEDHPVNATFELPAGATEFTPPLESWRALRGNLGYWWSVWLVDDATKSAVRSRVARCVVRHEPIARVEGSTLYGPRDSYLKFSGVE
jgi:radical SAM protein with 4Fe4S-binding SPASM domain